MSFKMIYPLVAELAADPISAAISCRVMGVSRAGYYEWRDAGPAPGRWPTRL
jgi:putative transposase